MRSIRRPGESLFRQRHTLHGLQKKFTRFAVDGEKQRSPEVVDDRMLISQENGNDMDCIGTGLDVECVVSFPDGDVNGRAKDVNVVSKNEEEATTVMESVLSTLLLISPFFFWGTAMVAMKGVLPKAGPMFVASTRLIPAGALLVGFARFV